MTKGSRTDWEGRRPRERPLPGNILPATKTAASTSFAKACHLAESYVVDAAFKNQRVLK